MNHAHVQGHIINHAQRLQPLSAACQVSLSILLQADSSPKVFRMLRDLERWKKSEGSVGPSRDDLGRQRPSGNSGPKCWDVLANSLDKCRRPWLVLLLNLRVRHRQVYARTLGQGVGGPQERC